MHVSGVVSSTRIDEVLGDGQRQLDIVHLGLTAAMGAGVSLRVKPLGSAGGLLSP